MKHLLLGGLAAGNELHVVHEEYIRRAVLLPEFGVAPLTDGLDELVGEGVALNIDDPVVRVVLVDLVGDGVQQVGLAQAGLAVDKQGVVGLGGPLGYRLGRRVGEFVGRAHHEPLKGVLEGGCGPYRPARVDALPDGPGGLPTQFGDMCAVLAWVTPPRTAVRRKCRRAPPGLVFTSMAS